MDRRYRVKNEPSLTHGSWFYAANVFKGVVLVGVVVWAVVNAIRALL